MPGFMADFEADMARPFGVAAAAGAYTLKGNFSSSNPGLYSVMPPPGALGVLISMIGAGGACGTAYVNGGNGNTYYGTSGCPGGSTVDFKSINGTVISVIVGQGGQFQGTSGATGNAYPGALSYISQNSQVLTTALGGGGGNSSQGGGTAAVPAPAGMGLLALPGGAAGTGNGGTQGSPNGGNATVTIAFVG